MKNLSKLSTYKFSIAVPNSRSISSVPALRVGGRNIPTFNNKWEYKFKDMDNRFKQPMSVEENTGDMLYEYHPCFRPKHPTHEELNLNLQRYLRKGDRAFVSIQASHLTPGFIEPG